MIRHSIFITALLAFFIEITGFQANAEDIRLYGNKKCSEFLASDLTIKPEQLPHLIDWLGGYIDGISSIAKIDLTSKVKISDFSGLVMTACSAEPNKRLIEQATVAVGIIRDAMVIPRKSLQLRIPADPQ